MQKIKANDLTIHQFYTIININMNESIPRYDKEIEILKFIYGYEVDYILDLPFEDVDDLIYNLFNSVPSSIVDSVTIGDRTFTLKGNKDDFKFTYRQYKRFEKSVVEQSEDYIHDLMATIYVDDSSESERSEFFKHNMTIEIASPFIFLLPKMLDNKK